MNRRQGIVTSKQGMTPLRRIRSERGLSQDDLARRIPQVSSSTIRAMDRGDYIPKGSTLLHVARGLGVSVEELLEGVEVPSREGAVRSTKMTMI